LTCAELRERLVNPASASLGGHAPIVQHLETCPDCRAALRAFAAIERLYRELPPGPPPPDLDSRVSDRLSTRPRGPRAFLGSPYMGIGAAAVALVLAIVLVLLHRRPAPRAPVASGAARGPGDAARAPEAEGPPPDILAVRSVPIKLDAAPPTEEERQQALGLLNLDFLESLSSLENLAAFFAEPIGPLPQGTGAGPPPARPPDTPDAIAARIVDWRRLSSSDRARLTGLDRAFRSRPEVERDILQERYRLVANLTPEERAGLRRLAARLSELEPARRARLEADLRAIVAGPAAERVGRFRALPFARGLTGQEEEAAERLLLLPR